MSALQWLHEWRYVPTVLIWVLSPIVIYSWWKSRAATKEILAVLQRMQATEKAQAAEFEQMVHDLRRAEGIEGPP